MDSIPRSHRAFDPPMSDPPDSMVICFGGPHDQRVVKARMLSNLSDGLYRKDPAASWKSPQTGLCHPVYRWKPNA